MIVSVNLPGLVLSERDIPGFQGPLISPLGPGGVQPLAAGPGLFLISSVWSYWSNATDNYWVRHGHLVSSDGLYLCKTRVVQPSSMPTVLWFLLSAALRFVPRMLNKSARCCQPSNMIRMFDTDANHKSCLWYRQWHFCRIVMITWNVDWFKFRKCSSFAGLLFCVGSRESNYVGVTISR